MYEYEGLQDVIFIALYCVAAFAALLACVYLLCRRGNAFMQEKGPESVKTIETPNGPLRLGSGVRSSLRTVDGGADGGHRGQPRVVVRPRPDMADR